MMGLVAFMSKKIVGMSLALIMGVSGASVLFGSSLLKSDVRPATKTNLSEQTIANNMDTILLLQEDEWEKLSAQERLDVLQAVANIEQRYLGLPNELNVGVANLDADIPWDTTQTRPMKSSFRQTAFCMIPPGKSWTRFATRHTTVINTAWWKL